MAQRREHVSVSSIRPIEVRAGVHNSNDFAITVRYVNPNRPSEGRVFELDSNQDFRERMIFDERAVPHGLIFVATTGDSLPDAALVVELIDLEDGHTIFPQDEEDPATPFDGEPAILDLRLISF